MIVGPWAYSLALEVDERENGHLPSYIAQDLAYRFAWNGGVNGFASWESDGQREFSLPSDAPLAATKSLSVQEVDADLDEVLRDGVLLLCVTDGDLDRQSFHPTIVGLAMSGEDRYVVTSALKRIFGDSYPVTHFFVPDDPAAFDGAYDVWFDALESSAEGPSIVAEYEDYLASHPSEPSNQG